MRKLMVFRQDHVADVFFQASGTIPEVVKVLEESQMQERCQKAKLRAEGLFLRNWV